MSCHWLTCASPTTRTETPWSRSARARARSPIGCPTFIDYLYVSTTNSSAFSPTDTMPLSSRMKMLMAVQATAALITSLLVIARAVSALQ